MDLPQVYTEIDIRERSPLSLAFVGDSVYELMVRARLVGAHRLSPARLNTIKVRYVSAKGQFLALGALEPLLTPQEQTVVQRGRNATKAAVAKHATPEEYRSSTAFESLFGWLYLQGQLPRLEQLFAAAFDAVSAAEKEE